MSSSLFYEVIVPKVWSEWLQALLETVGEVKMAPTYASRFYFLGANIMYDAVRCLHHNDLPLVDDFKELGDFPSKEPFFHPDFWTECTVHDGLYELYTHLSLPLTHLHRVVARHRKAYPNIYADIASSTSSMSSVRMLYRNRIRQYLHRRSTDGAKHAGTFQPMSEYPNQGIYIQTSPSEAVNQDLPHILSEPEKWCALYVNKAQSYLTPQWGDVRGVLSEETSRHITQRVGETYFPSPEVHAKEVEDVLELCQQLTEKEKMVAEFWAGGPGTCTPPGFWCMCAIYCARCHALTVVQQVRLYQRMTSALFEAGICAWRLKRQHLQERPIQSIRKLRPVREVRTYDGTTAPSDAWLPYQELDFVSPPFPDFVSGHSTFSSVGSKVLTDFFGTNVIPTTYQLEATTVHILSPILESMDPTCNLCQVNVYPRTSTIETGKIPSTGITLAWTTWDEMAAEAGRSRLYGGIHYESSNQGGMALGRLVHHHLFGVY